MAIESAKNEFISKSKKCFDDRKMGGSFVVELNGKYITGQCYYTDDITDDGVNCVSFHYTDNIDDNCSPIGRLIASAYAYYDECGQLTDEFLIRIFNSLIKEDLNNEHSRENSIL